MILIFSWNIGFGEQQTKEELTISLALVPKNGHTQWQGSPASRT